MSISLVLWAAIVIATSQAYNITGNFSSGDRGRHKRNDGVEPSVLKIRYHHQGQMHLAVLKKVFDTTLAGLYLPVRYIADNGDASPSNQLFPNPRAIPTFYHGVNSFSALTFFPGTQTLHGVLNQKVYVDDLPLHVTNNPDLVERFIRPIPEGRGHSQSTRNKRSTDRKRKLNADAESSPRKKFRGKEQKQLLYPEVFLIVDVPPEQINLALPNIYEKAIIYVVTYWNAVDMLFRTLKRTDVRINIAGILIGKRADLEASGLVNAEHIKMVGQRIFMLKEAALDSLGTYFYNNEIIDRDSHDFLIWMTSTTLVDADVWYQDDSDLRNLKKDYVGAAAPANCGGMHRTERRDGKTSNRAIVMYDDKYSQYHSAARGLAHLMFVSDDDVEVLHDGVRSNCLPSNPMIQSSGIMDPSNKRVGDYLFWSYCSEIHLATYSRSKSSCCLFNYPSRTLDLSDPPYYTSIKSQCECYGMRALDSKYYRRDICNMPLECKNKEGKSMKVAMPLDGTPCVSDEEEGESICNHRDCLN